VGISERKRVIARLAQGYRFHGCGNPEYGVAAEDRGGRQGRSGQIAPEGE
jgi:hypothetical protein